MTGFPNQKNQTVLIISNQHSEMDPFHHWFQKEGYEVISISNLVDSLGTIRELEFCLILLDADIQFPLGIEATIWILRTVFQSPSIALFVQESKQEAKQKLIDVDPPFWVHKPFHAQKTPNEILSILNNQFIEGLQKGDFV